MKLTVNMLLTCFLYCGLANTVGRFLSRILDFVLVPRFSSESFTSRKLCVCLEAFLCFLQLSDRAYASLARCVGLVLQWSFWHHMIKMKLFTCKSVDCFACSRCNWSA